MVSSSVNEMFVCMSVSVIVNLFVWLHRGLFAEVVNGLVMIWCYIMAESLHVFFGILVTI